MTSLNSLYRPRGAAPSALALTALLAFGGCNTPDSADTSEDSATESAGTGATSGSTTRGDAETEPGTSQSGTSSADGSGSGSETGDDAMETMADAFFVAIAGLWVAPVTSTTSAGNFPTMNMDVRPAGDRVLFSRVDLDPDNSLRFAFALEDRDGEAQLVFRNGGEFLGIERDTRTVLHTSDPQAGTWRFCATGGGGCDYVDATFTFSSDGASLDLVVDVLGMRHIEWYATRREARALSGPFPQPPTQAPDAPFPQMPTLTATARWDDPLAEPASLWVVLSTTTCGINPAANCVPSRFLSVDVPAGATEAELVLEQVHAGDYQVNAVLDRNRNLASGVLLPDEGDGVSLPDTPTTVPSRGNGEVTVDIAVEI